MKAPTSIKIFAVIATAAVGLLILNQWRVRTNPYKNQGLMIEWDFGGATSAYPWINVWVDHEGERIEPDFYFGGIEEPWLRFRDYDGDGRKDIIFRDDHFVQVLAFYPAENGNPPRFKPLRNDIIDQ